MSGEPSILLRGALRLEALLHSVTGARRTPRVIEPYTGYATPDHLVVIGRVHDRLTRADPRPDQRRFTNVAQMLGKFLTLEVAGATVRAGEVETQSDEEGYFTLEIPRKDEDGWHVVEVTLDATGERFPCPVLVPPATHDVMIVSDIDDTVMRTGAYSLVRNLWTTFSGNALSREVFADAAVLLDRLHADGARPVFYVSSSPWNLYYFLEAVFRRGALVRGPMFLRDLGLSDTKFITSGHGSHKGQAIDTILAANPDRPVILMGDTGQKDARIYRDAILRHPDRVRAVVLRTPGPGLDADDRRALAALEETGVAVFSGPSFAGFSERIEPLLG